MDQIGGDLRSGDGHVQAIPNEVDESELDEWNGHKDLEEVFKALGEGVF